jgi:beta-N-acetylhexosaminidase
MTLRRIVPLLAFLLSMCASAPQRAVPELSELTLDEKIGQLFVVPAHGVFMNEQSPAYRTLLRQVRDDKAGGVLWFTSDVYETAWLNARLQQEARVPLLVSADLEAGIGMRFEDTTYWPPAMAVAATGDPSLAEAEGRIVAREAKAIGINHLFAPVADVNADPDNPVINARSFGEDPADVARYVSAFVRGVQSAGLLACAKHFPGHGDTHVDSHRSLPVLDVTRERLQQVELVPFRAAIDAGVASVMTGHLSVPAIDAEPAPVRSDVPERENPYGASEVTGAATLPASVSAKVIGGILRNELGFDGLVVTDAFDMGGLVAHFDAGEGAVRAIEAGNDQIIKSADVETAIAAVKAAVRSGRLTEERIDASVRRILAAKRRTTIHTGSQAEIFSTVDSPANRAIAAEIAQRSITLVREASGTLPLSKSSRVLIVHVSDFAESSTPLVRIHSAVAERTSAAPRSILLDARAGEAEVAQVVDAAREADVVILALAIRARSGAGHMAIPDAARRAIAAIPPATKTIAISFGSPYVLRDLPELRTYVCAWGVQPVMQSAAAAALFGKAPITGKLPVTIPGLHARGEGIARP